MAAQVTQFPMEEGDGNGANAGILRPRSLSFRQALEKPQSVTGVRSSASPPPFLSKTLAMVEDPKTNSIISWGSYGTSIIIWDHLKFSKEILPKYFKHSNFSSFIYQLNNYGFKKIGLRQHEYENKWFQAGKKHLLVNMKRRNDGSKATKQQQEPEKAWGDAEKRQMEVELKSLRENIYVIKLEIQKLKQKKGDIENHLASFKEQGNITENKAQKMFAFLGKLFDPSFIQQLTENSEEEEEEDDQEIESHEVVKKMKLTAESTDKENGLMANNSISETNAARNDDPLIIWKKLLVDDLVSENENAAEKEASLHSSKICYMAFDDMMEKEDVIAKELITDIEDEVTFQLWA